MSREEVAIRLRAGQRWITRRITALTLLVLVFWMVRMALWVRSSRRPQPCDTV